MSLESGPLLLCVKPYRHRKCVVLDSVDARLHEEGRGPKGFLLATRLWCSTAKSLCEQNRELVALLVLEWDSADMCQ